jgi:hypothetical protein
VRRRIDWLNVQDCLDPQLSHFLIVVVMIYSPETPFSDACLDYVISTTIKQANLIFLTYTQLIVHELTITVGSFGLCTTNVTDVAN